MEIAHLPLLSIGIMFLLLLIPIGLSYIYKFRLISSLLSSVLRMSAQLLLIGIFLKYLFLWNHFLINLAWVIIMILVATFSTIKGASIKVTLMLMPIVISFSLTTFILICYLTIVVIRLDYIFDARYFIVLSGMLLGNSLRANIVALSSFYTTIKKDTKKYLYILSLGASHKEALLPYLQESISLALKPTLASMATMGIVALPGMMTGVILSGTSPELAIKYQIMIMIAIFVSSFMSVFVTIKLTTQVCFNKYGTLKENIFIANDD